MNKALKAARAKVNSVKFGTQAWEDAMAYVRALVEQENATAPKTPHTSIDGDVFSV